MNYSFFKLIIVHHPSTLSLRLILILVVTMMSRRHRSSIINNQRWARQTSGRALLLRRSVRTRRLLHNNNMQGRHKKGKVPTAINLDPSSPPEACVCIISGNNTDLYIMYIYIMYILYHVLCSMIRVYYVHLFTCSICIALPYDHVRS